MLSKARNSVAQGCIGLTSAIYHFSLKGYTVSIPLIDNQEYDLVVDMNGKLCKIQVKTTKYLRNGSYEVQLKTVRSNKDSNRIKYFDGSKVDYLYVLTEAGDTYLIPTDDSIPSSTITLGNKYECYKL